MAPNLALNWNYQNTYVYMLQVYLNINDQITMRYIRIFQRKLYENVSKRYPALSLTQNRS